MKGNKIGGEKSVPLRKVDKKKPKKDIRTLVLVPPFSSGDRSDREERGHSARFIAFLSFFLSRGQRSRMRGQRRYCQEKGNLSSSSVQRSKYAEGWEKHFLNTQVCNRLYFIY